MGAGLSTGPGKLDVGTFLTECLGRHNVSISFRELGLVGNSYYFM